MLSSRLPIVRPLLQNLRDNLALIVLYVFIPLFLNDNLEGVVTLDLMAILWSGKLSGELLVLDWGGEEGNLGDRAAHTSITS